MKLRWERKRLGAYCAFSDEGHELAQVAHILGPGGATGGENYPTVHYFLRERQM